jgi:hypothetical protein
MVPFSRANLVALMLLFAAACEFRETLVPIPRDAAAPIDISLPAYDFGFPSDRAPENVRCTQALAVEDGATLNDQKIDTAVEEPPSCTGDRTSGALFYRVKVPAGQRLEARVTTTSVLTMISAWTPLLQLQSDCGQSACLATGHDVPQFGAVLQYVNNGPTQEELVLSVAALPPLLPHATFRLEIEIGDPILNVSCAAARPIHDGLVLTGQRLPSGDFSRTALTCSNRSDGTLFYRANLVEHETLSVQLQARPRPSTNVIPTLQATVREVCELPLACLATSRGSVEYTNPRDVPHNVILEITSEPGARNDVFDMTISMRRPRGALSVVPVRGLTTTEAGGTATFSVSLNSTPRHPVMVALLTRNPREGVVDPTVLTFDPNNWRVPQIATVTGVDDDVTDGSQAYAIAVGPAISLDSSYAGLAAADVEVSNLDDEPGFIVASGPNLVTTESGGTATFTVTMIRAPTAPVHLPIRSGAPDEVSASPTELLFDPSNWAAPRVVTLTGVDDAEIDGYQPFEIAVGPAESADLRYQGIDAADVRGRNADDDAGPLQRAPISGALSCPYYIADQRISVDDAGNVIVLMDCTDAAGKAGIFAARSFDGGRTFMPPVDTGLLGRELRVVGTGQGRAMGVSHGFRGLFVSTTAPTGDSWITPPSALTSGGEDPLLTAAEATVVLVADGQLWFSADGGASLSAPQVFGPPGTIVRAVRVDVAGNIALALPAKGGLLVRRSADHGRTFDAGVLVPLDFQAEAAAFGIDRLFAADRNDGAAVGPLADPLAMRRITGLPAQAVRNRFLLTDQLDNLIIVDHSPDGAALHRVNVGTLLADQPRVFTPPLHEPSVFPLSPRALAIMDYHEGGIVVGVEIWP